MANVVNQLAVTNGGVSLFYYLKITGLPYYFFSVVNPTDPKYGASAWTLPTYASYPAYTAVQGMALPSGTLSQSFADMIGGIGNAEKMRLTLADFTATDANGPYQFLARLFATGIQAMGSQMTLARSLNPADTQAKFVNAPTVLPLGGSIPTFPVIHVGGEAFGTTWTSPVSGVTTVTVTGQRNLYPCSSVYPPIPVHTVRTNASDGTVDQTTAQRATFAPYSMIGRSCAFYVGAMDPSGVPLPEASSMLRFIGRISAITLGADGRYELQMDSLLANAGGQQLCSGLFTGQLKPNQIVIQQGANMFGWRINNGGLYSSGVNRVSGIVVVTPGVYTIEALIANINTQIATNSAASYATGRQVGLAPLLSTINVNGAKTAIFKQLDAQDGFSVWNYSMTNFGILQALGFDNPALPNHSYDSANTGKIPDWDVTLTYYGGILDPVAYNGKAWVCTAATSSTGEIPASTPASWQALGPLSGVPVFNSVTANNPIPGVFIPYGYITASSATATFQVTDLSPRWFFDQGDGSGQAFVRFGNGDIVRLSPSTGTPDGSYVTVGKLADQTLYPTPATQAQSNWQANYGAQASAYYSVPAGQTATVEQVVISPVDSTVALVGPGTMVGRFLASTGVNLNSGTLDCYPPGVGLGLGTAFNSESLSAFSSSDLKRSAVIDSSTTLADLFVPLAREYGWFLVWDPLLSQYAVKTIQVPNSGSFVSTLNESSRATVTDRTIQTQDQGALRSTWTLKWGYDRYSDSYKAKDLTIVDTYVVSSFGNAIKGETIEDKTLLQVNGQNALEIPNGLLLGRSYQYRIPFMKCKRTISKLGSILCPGDVVAFVDNTVVNPFTGNVGIASADKIYALLIQVDFDFGTCTGTVTALLNRQDPSSAFGNLAPCAALDYAATGHGYDTATGTVVCLNHYTGIGPSFYDGADFAVGDTVVIASKDGDTSASSPAPYLVTTTVTAVSGDGHQVTVASGLGAPPNGELIMYLRHYSVATAARKLSTAFQGDRATMLIEATVQSNRWA